MAQFNIQPTQLEGATLASRSTNPVTFIESPSRYGSSNEQWRLYRSLTGDYAQGYDICSVETNNPLGVNIFAGDPEGQNDVYEDTAGQGLPMTIASVGADPTVNFPFRLIIGNGYPIGTGVAAPGYNLPFVMLFPQSPSSRIDLNLHQVPNGNAPTPVMTATGENGNIAISGSNLPPGQYGVCYMGLRNPFDLYTTQGLQGPNFFGLEDVSESGELPPILDVVSIATASPQDWITAVLERVVDVQVNPRFHADRIVEAIAIIPASSFLH